MSRCNAFEGNPSMQCCLTSTHWTSRWRGPTKVTLRLTCYSKWSNEGNPSMSHFGLARGPTKVTLRLIGPDVMTPRVVPTSRCHVENRMSAMSRIEWVQWASEMHVTRCQSYDLSCEDMWCEVEVQRRWTTFRLCQVVKQRESLTKLWSQL